MTGLDCVCGNRMMYHDGLTYECRACHRLVYGPDLQTNDHIRAVFRTRLAERIAAGAVVCPNCHRVMLGDNGVRECRFCHKTVRTMESFIEHARGITAYVLILAMLMVTFAYRMVS